MKGIVKGIISITVVVGGTIFTVSEADVVQKFAEETGLSPKEAQQFVENSKEDMVSFEKAGAEIISDGQSLLSIASGVDCVKFKYEWETNLLSCPKGKSQLISFGNDQVELGQAITTLASESASRNDMSSVISLIDRNNADLKLEIVSHILDPEAIDATRKKKSYNKALLQSALESQP